MNKVLQDQEMYAACISIMTNHPIFEDQVLYQLCHRILPIMLGSDIDIHIRGEKEVQNTLFGTFIVRGMKLIPNFITNNLGTGHVYRLNNRTGNTARQSRMSRSSSSTSNILYIFNMNTKQHNLRLQYYPDGCLLLDKRDNLHKDLEIVSENCERFELNVAHLMKNYQKIDQEDDYDDNEEDEVDEEEDVEMTNEKVIPETKEHVNILKGNCNWHEMIHNAAIMECSTPKDDHIFSQEDYIDFFNACLKHAPKLDYLSNKVIISPPELLLRTINHQIKNNIHIKMKKLFSDIKKEKNIVVGFHNMHEHLDLFRNVSDNFFLFDLTRKLKLIFQQGNMYFAVSMKTIQKVSKDYASTMYQSLGGQKHHISDFLTSMTKRNVTEKSRNCKALKFPKDGNAFICPNNIREMQGAGETIYLTALTYTTPPLDKNEIVKIFEKYDQPPSDRTLLVNWNGFLRNYHISVDDLLNIKQDCPLLTFMIYDKYLIIYSRGHQPAKWSIKYNCFIAPYEEHFIEQFKNSFEFYDNTMNKSAASMLLPHSNSKAQPPKSVVALSNIKGRCDIIDNDFALSAFIGNIGTTNMALIPPINHFNESAINVNDDIDIRELIKDLNVVNHFKEIKSDLYKTKDNVYIMNDTQTPIGKMTNNDKYREFYRKLAEKKSNYEDMPDNLKLFYNDNVFRPINDFTEKFGSSYQSLIPNAREVFRQIDDIFAKWQPVKYYLVYKNIKSLETKGTWKKKKQTDNKSEFEKQPITSYNYNFFFPQDVYKKPPNNGWNMQILYANRSKTITLDIVSIDYVITSNQRPQLYVGRLEDLCHLRLWCAIGDFDARTNEDGIIIDKSLCENGPVKVLSGTIQIKINDYKHLNRKHTISINQNKCKLHFLPSGEVDGCKILIGLLISFRKLLATKSSTVNIIETKVGNHFRYFLIAEQIPHNVDLTQCMLELSNCSIILHYRKNLNLGVGTKIANLHGQKGICTTVDMSNFPVAYKRDGTKVHPQICFSPISVIGRTISSQIYEMLSANEDEIAVTPDGVFYAVMSFNVHHIDSMNKVRTAKVKCDQMTVENGFIANNLLNVLECLNNQTNRDNDKHFHHMQQLMNTTGLNIERV